MVILNLTSLYLTNETKFAEGMSSKKESMGEYGMKSVKLLQKRVIIFGGETNSLIHCDMNKTCVIIKIFSNLFIQLFHDGGHYHIETSSLICSPNQWAGF